MSANNATLQSHTHTLLSFTHTYSYRPPGRCTPCCSEAIESCIRSPLQLTDTHLLQIHLRGQTQKRWGHPGASSSILPVEKPIVRSETLCSVLVRTSVPCRLYYANTPANLPLKRYHTSLGAYRRRTPNSIIPAWQKNSSVVCSTQSVGACKHVSPALSSS